MQHAAVPVLADPVFQPQVAPGAAFAHPAWQEARAAILAGLDAGGVTVLVGPPGSGKSLLLKDLARTLSQSGRTVHMRERTGDADPPPQGGVLLVDEADTLPLAALAPLCEGPGPVLLAALPGFAERLAGHPRPVHHVELGRLAPRDTARYVAARLAAAGRPRDLLEPEAVLALARHSGGLVRLVNTLGGAAVFLAGLDGAARVAPRHVEEAAAMREGLADVAPPAPPLPVEPVPALRSYRAAELRRRAALGGMVAASAVLFAMPWLTSRRRPTQTPAGQPLVEARMKPVLPAAAPPAAAAGEGGASQAAVLPPAVQPVAAQPALGQPAGPVLDPVDVAGNGPDPAAVGSPSPDAPPPRPALQAAVPAQPGPVRQAVAGPAPAARPGGRVVLASDAPVRFHGPIFNETMGQGGHVTLVIRKQAPAGAITARFDASQGLVGTGVLAGSESGGRITASGQLLMGRNPFLCDLSGTLNGDTLTGSARFVHAPGGVVYHSRFSLVRA